MKRMIYILLSILLMTNLYGCAGQNKHADTPVTFYYCHNTALSSYTPEDGLLAGETRDSAAYRDNLAGLIELYLQGPVSQALENPFSPGLHVLGLTQAENILDITLDGQPAQHSGYDTTVACACLANTLFGLTDAVAVQVSVQDSEGEKVLLYIDRAQLILEDSTLMEE